MIVAAHPDDETLGVGGQLPDWPDTYVVHLTAGAPKNLAEQSAYALLRHQELSSALDIAGVAQNHRIRLGAVDQEVARQLVPLSRDISHLYSAIRPDLVLTHPYEGGHPDHDATAFVVWAAAQLSDWSPYLAEFTSYHNGSPFGELQLKTGCFLPNSESELIVLLDQARQATKQKMLDCFISQQEIISRFGLQEERFRPLPVYDYSQPPHAGVIYYDTQEWGCRSVELRALVVTAMAELGLPGPSPRGRRFSTLAD